MSEVAGLSGEQIQRLVVWREIEEMLDRGFKGEIVLHCTDGCIPKYHFTEYRTPGQSDRRTHERRTAGPRVDEDRRRG